VTTILVLVGVATEPVGPPPLIDTPGVPVLAKKPDGYVSLCAPAGNASVAVVHTIVNVPAVIVQEAVSVALPDAANSSPAGPALALK
jgi:hypothetical protein